MDNTAPIANGLEDHVDVFFDNSPVFSLGPEAIRKGLRPVAWFDTDSLPIMQEAARNRLTTAKIGFDMGIPLNELNRVYDLGFKSFPWGDTPFVSNKVTPLTNP